MGMRATVVLTDLVIACDIGTYEPDDVVPDHHILDLTLTIAPQLVFIDEDSMERVFDYDPLISEIDRLARDGHYHTQERLMTRIVEACATFEPIKAVDIHLTKGPVLDGTGKLGVRLVLDEEEMAAQRRVV
ncbi:MAG: dihydroneopterin aldolase [Pseudomonadota bacterium]